MFFIPLYVKDDCYTKDEKTKDYVKFLCKEGEYSPLGSLLFMPTAAVYNALLNPTLPLSPMCLFIYFIIWYPMTLISFGSNIPAGVYVQGILIGTTYGRFVAYWFNYYYTMSAARLGSYAVLGAASFITGYTGQKYSIAIIMMESTGSITIFVPLMLAIVVSYIVGRYFIDSIYANAMRSKAIPFLRVQVPAICRRVTAEILMSRDVKCLPLVATVKEISLLLRETKHNGFPIVGDGNKILGLISRDYLYVLLKKQCWVEEGSREFSKKKVGEEESGVGSLNNDLRQPLLEGSP
jgi:CBS domain-containing protein